MAPSHRWLGAGSTVPRVISGQKSTTSLESMGKVGGVDEIQNRTWLSQLGLQLPAGAEAGA